ncbi:MAG: CBS domain-containing protein, partial [Desulfosudaceae bacterium]
ARKIHLVSAEMNALAVLNELISNKAHISLVVDDYGGTEGVLTIEDVVESLLGMEIIDETDSVRNMRTVARQRWLERRKRTGEKYKKGGAAGQKPPPE